MHAVSRRRFIRQSATVAGTLVVGFDLSTRAGATTRQPTGALAQGFPAFDGILRTEAGARAAAADDLATSSTAGPSQCSNRRPSTTSSG